VHRDRGTEFSSVHLLNSTLPLWITEQITGLDLPCNNQEFPMLHITAGNRSYDVRKAGPCSYERKSPFSLIVTLVEVLCADSGRNLVNHRNTFKSTTDTIEQMHDSPTCYKEAMGIPEFK
jgi:hypothetical protein